MQIVTGDLLSNTTGILVQGCNCHGKMGAGIAGIIRKKYPDVFKRYESLHAHSGLQLGTVQFVHNRARWADESPAILRHLSPRDGTSQLPERLIVANAMTQFDYGNDPGVVYVDYDAVFSAFSRIRMVARDSAPGNELTVRYPLIGAGLANGVWHVIEEAIADGLGGELFEKSELWLLPGTSKPLRQEAPRTAHLPGM
jgi:hypothetical protein